MVFCSPLFSFLVFPTLPFHHPQVIFHATHRRPDAPLDAPPLATTRGGPPHACVLGTAGRPRAPRAFELALASIAPGARVAVRCAPSYNYGRGGATLPPPAELAGQADADVCAELDCVAVVGKGDVVSLTDCSEGDDSTTASYPLTHWKVTLTEGTTWETPRPPFEVTARVAARVPAGDVSSSTDLARAFTSHPAFWTADALTATMGDGTLPPALEATLASVSPGERAVVCVDASRCLGGTPSVPPPPTDTPRLELDITLTRMIQVRDLTGDGAVTKRRVREGVGEFPADCPLQDTTVRIRAAATNEGDATPFWTVGGGPDVDEGDGSAIDPFECVTGTAALPDALDVGVRLMTPRERSTLTAAPSHAWATRGDAPAGYDPTRTTTFDVVLTSFDAPVRDVEATPSDRLARASTLREQGNSLWAADGPRAGELASIKWKAAARELGNALDFVGASDEETAAAAACRAAAHANLALAASAESAWGAALDWCDKALEDDPGHVKALLRKARAAAALGRRSDADAALVAAETADPGAAADVAKERARIAARAVADERKQRAEMKGFLG